MLSLNKEVGVYIKEDYTDVKDDPDEEEMEDFYLYDERELHWRIVFKGNYGGVGDKKSLRHAKMWDVYMNERVNLIKGGYLVEVFSSDGKKVIWGVVGDHVVE